MADYTRNINSAYFTIKKKGAAIIIRRSTKGTYNPVTESSTGATTRYSTYGVFTDFRTNQIDGTVIKRGDKRCIIPAKNLSITPSPDTDVLFINGNPIWNIVEVETVAPDGTAIIYKVQVRK